MTNRRPVATSYTGTAQRDEFIRQCRPGDVLLIGGATHLSLVVQSLDMCPFNHVMVVTGDGLAHHAFPYRDEDSDFRQVSIERFFRYPHPNNWRATWVDSAALLRSRAGLGAVIVESAQSFAQHNDATFRNEEMLLLGVISTAATELADQVVFPAQPGAAAWTRFLGGVFGLNDGDLTCAQSIHAGWPDGLTHNFDLGFTDFPAQWLDPIENPALQETAKRLIREVADKRSDQTSYGLADFRKSLEAAEIIDAAATDTFDDHMRVVMQLLLAVFTDKLENVDTATLNAALSDSEAPVIRTSVTAGDFWRCDRLFEPEIITWVSG